MNLTSNGRIGVNAGGHVEMENALLAGNFGAMIIDDSVVTGSLFTNRSNNVSANGRMATDNFINDGSVTASGTLLLENTSTTNNGILAADGGTITINGGFGATQLTNYSGGVLTGGSFEVSNGGTIDAFGWDITTNASNIKIASAGSRFETVDINLQHFDGLQNLSNNTSNGSLTLEKGASLNTAFVLENSGLVMVLDDASLIQVGGEYRQIAGSTRVDGTLEASNFIIDGGFATGDGIFDGDMFNNGWTLAPGNSTGETQITGDYVQDSNGIMAIELGGLNDFDLIGVGNQTFLDGTLDIQLLEGYQPDVGDQFMILQSQFLSGTFASINNPGNYTFDVLYSQEGFVQLSVTAIPEPASGLLAFTGLVLLGLRRQKRPSTSP